MARSGAPEFEAVPDGAPRRLRLSGSLDMASAPQLREQLASALGEGDGDLVLDVSALGFVDSSGLGSLIATARRLALDGHQLVLRRPTAPVRKVLEVTNLDNLFRVEG